MAGDNNNNSNLNDPLVTNTKSNRPRVGVILRQSLGGAKSSHSSAEMEELKERYKTMCQHLKTLQKSLKERHAALLSTAQSRALVAQSVSSLSQESPLADVAGSAEDTKSSYYGVMVEQMDGRTKQRATEFETLAINYVAEWERTVTTRINADLKTTDNLCRDADHYQAKVDSLQANVKKMHDQKKTVPDATLEKLERNETKLKEARTIYNDAAQDLYLLMEEVVDRSWRDLHPLLLQIIQWDTDMCQEEDTHLASPIQKLQSTLVKLAQTEQIKPRLDRFMVDTPESLSTRPGGTKNLNLSFGAKLVT